MCRDKVSICTILGVNISVLSMKATVDYIKRNLYHLSGTYICVSNVHTTVMSYDDPEYKEIQNKAVMALPDGGPLSTVARMRGYKSAERVTGPDLMGRIFEESCEAGYSHFFYGSKPETLEMLKEKLRSSYPGLKIVGIYSPPFRELTNEEDEEIMRNINESNPDFLWVGLGAPKQERWMAAHKGKVKGLMIGVGAGFDYYAGKLKRAPEWMQRHNLEWVYRLMQEPRRLIWRYLHTNTKFLWLVVKEK